MGYQPEKDETVIVVTNVYSAPDGASPATEITKLILKALASDNGEGTRESSDSEGKGK